MKPGRRTVGVVLVVLVILLATVAYGLFAVNKPSVQSVENGWGTVNENRSEVETEIRVDDSTLLRVGDSVADVRYTVTLNDVKVAEERKERVRLSGENDDVVAISTWMNNDKVPEWWASHVNRNETTTVTVDPEVVLQYGIGDSPVEAESRKRTFRTNLLEPLRTNQKQRLSAFDRTLLVVNETNARWGHATTERTPIRTSMTLTNSLPVALPITDIQYTIRMNGIVVGQGTAVSQTSIPAGATRTLEARAHIDNSKLDEWWVTHLRNDEKTRLTVEFDATVEVGGEERTIPLDFISYNRSFTTDVFGTSPSANATGYPGSNPDAPSSSDGQSTSDRTTSDQSTTRSVGRANPVVARVAR